MSDLIKREDAIEALYKYNFVSKDVIEREIKAIPSADRPQGEWIPKKASIHPYGYDVECSVCGHRMGSSFGYKFCPMCGAKMKGAEHGV